MLVLPSPGLHFLHWMRSSDKTLLWNISLPSFICANMLSFVGLYSTMGSNPPRPRFAKNHAGSDVASSLPATVDAMLPSADLSDDTIESPRLHSPQPMPAEVNEPSGLSRVSPSPSPLSLETMHGPECEGSISELEPVVFLPVPNLEPAESSCVEPEVAASPPRALDSEPQSYTQLLGTENQQVLANPSQADFIVEATGEESVALPGISPGSSIPASSLQTRDDSATEAASASTTPTPADLPSVPPAIPPNLSALQNPEDTGDTSSAASTNGEDGSVFDNDYFSDTSSYTASLLSDVKNFTYENGRRYHSYREGHYVLPNDDQEQDRQDLLHHVRNLTLNGALFRAPLGKNIQRVLDLGTGTGIWAIDFADSYPSAEVIGTDLSPIQPSWVPPNLRFLVDDAESPWLFSTSRPFDFIHVRDLGGAIADWPRLLRQGYRHLRPGGWIELQEFEVTLRSDDDSLRLAPTLREFLGRLHAASETFQRPMNIAEGHRQRLIEAGFEDVRDEVYKVRAWTLDSIRSFTTHRFPPRSRCRPVAGRRIRCRSRSAGTICALC